jgi:hypothetical protein
MEKFIPNTYDEKSLNLEKTRNELRTDLESMVQKLMDNLEIITKKKVTADGT